MKNKNQRRLRLADIENHLRGRSAFEATLEYQEEMRKTPEGARSDDLRKEAQKLKKQGDLLGAHELFLRAAAQHNSDDNGAAAAACWFDLGLSFKEISTGVRSQNLIESLRLLRRAEESPRRRADVRRHILSLDGLGQTLRVIAAEQSSPHDALHEAIQHFQKAVDLARSNGLATLDLLADNLMNMGNALMQAERINQAIHTYEESLKTVEWIEREAPQIEQLMFGGLQISRRRLNLAEALRRRGASADLKKALKLLQVIHQDPTLGARALFLEYNIRRNLKGSDSRSAKDYIERINVELLQPEEQRQFLAALADEGELERALELAHRGVSEAFAQRRRAKADSVADHCALEAQQFSRLAAELLVDAKRDVAAFAALENTAALRYFDGVTRYSWAPNTPLLSSIHKLYTHASGLSAILDDLALRMAEFDPEKHGKEVGEFLDQFLEHLHPSLASEFEWEGTYSQIKELFERVKTSSIPSSVLRHHSNIIEQHAITLKDALMKLNPDMPEITQAWSDQISETTLEALFVEHPDVVLLKLSMTADNLLAISVWQEESKLVGDSSTYPVPKGTLNALLALTSFTHLETAAKKQAQAALNAFLTSLDLSTLLPASKSHVVILPSRLASLVPWAASGPEERKLISSVDALSYLPNITPMLMRQAPFKSRSKTLVVTPGAKSAGAPTRYHHVAFKEASDGETRLEEDQATREAVCHHAATSDIVSFFAHGHYAPDNPGAIRLADGDFFLGNHTALWQGMERVELWACRSGVNVSYDPLTPWVDEAFGLDVTLHSLGVRSTIGTFWNVPDLVTAVLVREYRRSLARGRRAPAALADAQRWWLTQGLVLARTALESERPDQQLRELAAMLGVESQSADVLVTGMLGPAKPNEKLSPDTIDAILLEWASPTAWAGFRFLGVCERRPNMEAPQDELDNLTSDERDMIETLLKPSVPATNTDELFENRLSTVTSLAEGSPSTNQAITAARLYATRRRSSRTHSLGRALAWIHEALAAPALDASERSQLQREAAWLWFDLAIGEIPLAMRHLYPMNYLLLGRATDAAALLPTGPERTILELALTYACSGALNLESLFESWELIKTQRGSSIEGLRLRTLLVALILTDREAAPLKIATELMDELCEMPSVNGDELRWRARYAIFLAQLVSRPGLDDLPIPSLPDAQYLPHELFIQRCDLAAKAIATHDDAPADMMLNLISNDLSLLEADFWGYRRDDGLPSWLNTGSPGAGWKRFVGSLLASEMELPQWGPQFIASIHLGADLRIAPLAATSVVQGGMDQATRHTRDLAMNVRGRERLLNLLMDSAAIGHTAVASDLFSCTREQAARSVSQGPEHLTSWLAEHAMNTWEWDGAGDVRARTAAFDIERSLIKFDAEITKQAQQFIDIDREPGRALDEGTRALVDLMFGPPRDLEALKHRLATLPPDIAVLGAFEGAQGELLLATVWTDQGQSKQAIHVTPDATGAMVAQLLGQLQHVHEEDLNEACGSSSIRNDDWITLRNLLDEPLGAVMRHIGHRTVRVLAPHSLRGLPWLGLTADGKPIHTLVRGMALLPFLGFENISVLREPTATPNTICVLGGTLEHGDTRFGAAVIKTLRRIFPDTLTGEPSTSPGTTITEVDVIEPRDSAIEVLRFYGTGSPWSFNASTQGLVLSHNRTLSLLNLDFMKLSSCECVELWAATEGHGASSQQATYCDELPTLVRGFLTAGAGGVIDLAWPIHDLVKSLVCESFALHRRAPKPPAEAIILAVSDTAKLLDEWKHSSTSFSSVKDALRWLDVRRQEYVHRTGTTKKIQRFEPLAKNIEATTSEFIDVCCQPVHLAAFRWWGA